MVCGWVVGGNVTNTLTELVGVAASLQNCISEMIGSIPFQETGYSEIIRSFTFSLPKQVTA
jgi:hypothetical protein